MKKIILFGLTLMLSFLGITWDLNGQTKVFDQTITWEYPPYEYGGYGFYWWHRTDVYSNINYGDMPSDNWASPNDFYNGDFTLTVEVVDQPTSEPFYIQFGIWGDSYKGLLHTETVAGRKWVEGGAGSSGTYGLGTPSTWWNKQAGDPLDFSRADDFYRIGVVLWDGASTCIPMGTDWSSDGCPENAYKYFPMTIKISVYATPGTGGPIIYPPNYSIDYWGERTNKEVSSDDQYSYDNFAGGTVYDGNNTFLGLTPGTNVYFRKKSDWSKTQTLNVPYRPGEPSFGIDYPNERTSSTVSNEYKYSSNSDMSGATTGDGSYVGLTPGSSIYFRKSANSSAFHSETQTLNVPSRPGAPGFGIDYPNERISTTVSSEYQHSPNSDLSSATTGDGSHVGLTPGSSIYFRKLSSGSVFASSIQELIVQSRPAAPSFGIDFINSRTSSAIGSSYEYALQADMSDAVSGTGNYVDISADGELYFHQVATSSMFTSNIQSLIAPGRPAAPSFLIDYIKEEISEPIGTGYSYSYNPDMSDAIAGTENLLQITPGINVYFREAASASAFASEIQMLVSPARPGAPSAGIDFINETTDDAISSALQYSGSSGFETSKEGTGVAVDIVPGADLYLRLKATGSSYSSEVFHLVVPDRPEVSSEELDSTTFYPFVVEIVFFEEVMTLSISDVAVANADLKNLNLKSSGPNESVFEGLVYATTNDDISILVPANTLQDGNFVSNTFEVFYKGQLPNVGIESNNLNPFTVFPNPGRGVFHMRFTDFNAHAYYKVELYSITGEILHTERFSGSADMRLDLSDVSEGFYLLRLSENEKITGVVKLIIK